MALGLPPLSYNLRSLWVRWSSTLLTIFGIGATVAVLAGILALQQGFATLYADNGRSDVVVFLRPGATSEGESNFRRASADELIKSSPAIAQDAEGRPLASGEIYLAMRLNKLSGGQTNVPIRGVQPTSLTLAEMRGEGGLAFAEGRAFEPGRDEVIVGLDLTRRIRGCAVGEVLMINTTPFTVVGVFGYDGPFQSEIWGDVDRLGEALQRPGFNRIIARLKDGESVAALKATMAEHPRTPAKVLTEQDYLSGQTLALSVALFLLGTVMAVIMGAAAALTGMNTMFAALSSRSHEIGVLISIGFRPIPVFLSFLFEAITLGLLGGLVGCLMVWPLHGIDTGTTNFQTFTEVSFAFRVTPLVLGISVAFAMGLGLIGGLIPAWVAATSDPVDALRRR